MTRLAMRLIGDDADETHESNEQILSQLVYVFKEMD